MIGLIGILLLCLLTISSTRFDDVGWVWSNSEFETPSALFDNDAQIEQVWKTAYPLADFTAPTNFKSYEELKTRLDTVLSGTVTVGNVVDNIEESITVQSSPKVDTKPVESVTTVAAVEEDDTMSYFEKLAKE